LYQLLLLSFRSHPLTRWIIAHLDQRITLDDMAWHARLGARQLTRHFRQMVGATPMHFVQNLRMTEAQRRLVMSDASIKRIATSLGYRSPHVFRKAFERSFGLAPTSYRQRFGAVARPSSRVAR